MSRNKEIYFHASGVGNLMIGGKSLWTDKDDDYLFELRSRKNGAFKTDSGRKGQYTVNMRSDHIDLIKRRRAVTKTLLNGGDLFELGDTAKTYIEDVWRHLVFGFKEPMMSKEVMKGMMTEQDCIDLVSEVDPIDAFRSPTTPDDRRNDGMFNGLKDINYSIDVDFIEDIKSAWSLKQYMKIKTIEDINPLYYAQGHVYMHLYGKRKFKVQYCLVDTPEELIEAEKKRFFYRLGGDADQEDYVEISEQIEKNHIVSHIEPEYRVKTFEFDFDDVYFDELVRRCHIARKYFNTIRLNDYDKEKSQKRPAIR